MINMFTITVIMCRLDDTKTRQNHGGTISIFEDNVMCSHIAKSFKCFTDKFYGTVTDVDDNVDPHDQRLFKCEYDDGDVKWIPKDDMIIILVSVQSASEMSAQQENGLACVIGFFGFG